MPTPALIRLLRSGDVWLLSLLVGSFGALGATRGAWWGGVVAGLVPVALLLAFERWKGAVFDGPFLAPARRAGTLILLAFVCAAAVLSLAYSNRTSRDDKIIAGTTSSSTQSTAPNATEKADERQDNSSRSAKAHEPTSSEEDNAMAKAVAAVTADPSRMPPAAKPELVDIPTPTETPKAHYFDDVLQWADKKPGGREGLAQMLCPPGSAGGPPCQLAALLLGGFAFGMGQGDPIEEVGKALDEVQKKQYGPLATLLLSSPPSTSYERILKAIAKRANLTPEELMTGLATMTPVQACTVINANKRAADRARAATFAEEQMFARRQSDLTEFQRCMSRQ